MKESPHITFESIADLAEGRLAAEEKAKALFHLSGCDRCSRLKERIERTIELARDDNTEEAPEYAISRAVGLLRSRTDQSRPVLRRSLAILSFDSLELAPAVGVRAGEALERQVVFTAGENTVHMQIASVRERCAVFGQLLGVRTSGDVEAIGTSESVKAEIDEAGEFVFPSLPSGEYTFIVRLSDGEVEISGLKLGTPQ